MFAGRSVAFFAFRFRGYPVVFHFSWNYSGIPQFIPEARFCLVLPFVANVNSSSPSPFHQSALIGGSSFRPSLNHLFLYLICVWLLTSVCLWITQFNSTQPMLSARLQFEVIVSMRWHQFCLWELAD